MSITYEQANERGSLKDELAPLRRLKEAKHSGQDVGFQRERLLNEELTDIAEAIDNLYLESRFEYGFDGNHVVLPDGTPLVVMYEAGAKVAERLAGRHPEFEFEHKRRLADVNFQVQIDAMMRGETQAKIKVMLLPYPEEAELRFGKKHMEDNGYKPGIRRGMVQIAKLETDSKLSLTTLSLDNSSLALFQGLQALLGQKPGGDTLAILQQPKTIDTNIEAKVLAGQLIEFYDTQLERQTGVKHRRGRRDPAEGNSMDLLARSHSVVDFYVRQLDLLSDDWVSEHVSPQLALTIRTILNFRDKESGESLVPDYLKAELALALTQRRLTDEGVSVIKRALEISAWATIVKRLEQPNLATAPVSLNSMLSNAYEAEASGQRMVGCGGTTSLFEMDRTSVLRSLFGSSSTPEARYSFNRKMHCVVCQKPPRLDQKTKKVETKKWCGPCGICAGCDTQIKKAKRN